MHLLATPIRIPFEMTLAARLEALMKEITAESTNAESRAIALLRGGDLDGLSELIPLYQHRLYRYLVRLVSDTATAEDLFQETWMRVAKNIARYDASRSFDRWLFSMAHNLAIDHFRRHRPEELNEHTMPDTKPTAGALDQLLDSERAAMVSDAIGELTAPYREIIALRFGEGLSLDEIAEVTGAPLPTAKSRLRRALQTLREKFQ